MTRTGFGSLLVGCGWGCFVLAAVAQSLAVAVLGLLLVAGVTTAPRARLVVDVRREAPARVVAEETFDVVVTVRDLEGGRAVATQAPPPGVRIRSTRRESTPEGERLHLRMVSDVPGVVAWGPVEVASRNAWGTDEARMAVPVRGVTEVAPARGDLALGARAAHDLHERTTTRHPRGFDLQPEIERVRDYQPGDRLRDIAWPQVAKLQRLVTRELVRETSLPLVLLVQATSGMRARTRRSKLDTTVRTASALLSAARTAGVSAGLVAWSERGVEAQHRVSSGSVPITHALAALTRLPPALPRAPEAPASLSAAARPTSGERRFLDTIARFQPRIRGGVTPTEAAMASLTRITRQPSLVVAFLDAEESPALVEALMRRLRRHGHRALVAVPATGAHHLTRADVDAEALDRLVEWRRNRVEAQRIVERHGGGFVVLGPHVSADSLEEVVRSAW